ncbi:hypothetical protein N9U70_00885 [Paracoccaceae bacterium]|nr:hypothetical protein [Paracoccaceae bacterium]
MEPFFELRIYEVYPNKMSEWIEFMDVEIIPFQREKGMEINGTFVMNSSDEFFEKEGERKMYSEKKGSTYVWIRRFLDQHHKKRLYEAVYDSSQWIDYYRPRVSKLINLNTIVVHNLSATAMSLLK